MRLRSLPSDWSCGGQSQQEQAHFKLCTLFVVSTDQKNGWSDSPGLTGIKLIEPSEIKLKVKSTLDFSLLSEHADMN